MLRRLLLSAVLATLPLLAKPVQAQAPAAGGERVVNVFNWNDYIDPYMVQRFTRETGIRVRYDVYDSLERWRAGFPPGDRASTSSCPRPSPRFRA